MSNHSEIVCRPTKWFVWRAILMLVMFGGFGAYFLYDWKVGYPEKNYVVANYRAFSEAGQAWTSDANRESPEVWAAFVDSKTLPFDDEKGMYPADTDFEEKWPDIIKEMANKRKTDDLWKEYSKEKGWPQKVDLEEDPKPIRKIKEQLVAALICFALTAITLFFLIRTKGRTMKADDKGYYPPGGKLIPYGEMTTLDKRKWESKGLANLTYSDGGDEKKAKIDGMVYGQFKEEDGAPAEALFQKILANFEGELIELVVDEDEDETPEEAERQDDPGEKDDIDDQKE